MVKSFKVKLLQETNKSWIQYMNSCHQYRISKYSGFRCTGVISHTQENTLESIYQWEFSWRLVGSSRERGITPILTNMTLQFKKKKNLLDLKEVNVVKCMMNTKNFWHKKYIFCVNLKFFLECLMCVRWSVWTLHLLWELISLYFVIPHRSETHPNPIHFNEPGFQ